MADLLLVHPLFLSQDAAEAEATSPYFPLGLLYLASYVRRAGHAVTIFDATFEADEASFTDVLAERRPDLVGISALAPSADTARRLAGLARRAGCITVMGGPDPTSRPTSYVTDPNVDVVVHHEGEETLVRLLELHDTGDLTSATLADALAGEPGIAVDGPRGMIVNEPRPPIADLDSLPDPARDLIDMDRYLDAWRSSAGYASLTVSTSRGCPHGCGWCRDAVHGDGFRQRSPENVAAEVAAITAAYDIDNVRLVDDVDALDAAWFHEWADHLAELDSSVPFEPLDRPTRTDLPLLEVRDSL